MQCPSPAPTSSPPTGKLPHAGTAAQATLVELFSPTVVDGAMTGFALGHLPASPKPLLWVQDRLTRREAGRPCIAGLPKGVDLIVVDVSKAADVLWTMEEGLRCNDLCGVLGEIWGDPPALDFTATKRLAIRAEANKLPAWLLRRVAHPNLSAARERWHINSLPSLATPHDTSAPGQAQWQTELFRARWRTPGHWVAQHDPKTGLHFHHAKTSTPATPTALRA